MMRLNDEDEGEEEEEEDEEDGSLFLVFEFSISRLYHEVYCGTDRLEH